MDTQTRPDTTLDRFLGGRILVRQPTAGYRAGLDAVLLAAAVPASGGAVLDLGAGVGTAGLCVAARLPHVRVTLLEREPVLAALARENVAANTLSARITVLEADATGRWSDLAAAGLAREHYAHVIANPPYHQEEAGTVAPSDLKARANHMKEGALEGWARTLATAAAGGGSLALIYRADGLGSILEVLDRRFGALSVLPVLPKAGEDAIRIIVRGVKGSRAPLRLCAPLILHEDDGAFRDEIAAVLREGAPLPEPHRPTPRRGSAPHGSGE